MKFRTKGFTSLLMGACFLVISMSGIVMYVTPNGRVANWTNWSLLGLSKHEWGSVHTNACLLFMIVSVCHLVFNWKVFWSYIRNRAGGLNLRLEMLIATLIVFAVVAGTLLNAPPFSSIKTLNHSIKVYWARQTPPGPAPHAEDFSVRRFANATGLPLDDCTSALRQEGFVVADPSVTIASLAEQKNVAPSDVYSAIKRHFPAALKHSNADGAKLQRAQRRARDS